VGLTERVSFSFEYTRHPLRSSRLMSLRIAQLKLHILFGMFLPTANVDVEPGYDDKGGVGDVLHHENLKIDDEVVVDTEAKGYIDHNIVIDDVTNRRLRRMINFR